MGFLSRTGLPIVARNQMRLCCIVRSKSFVRISFPLKRFISNLPPDAAYYPSPAVVKAMSEATPFIDSCSAVVISLHQSINGPFWASLLIITFTARAFLTLPLAVLQRQILLRLSQHRPEFDAMVKQIALQARSESKSHQWSEEKTSRVFRFNQAHYRNQLYVKYNCHPARAFLLPFIQIPLWIMLSLGIRGLCNRAQTASAALPIAASPLESVPYDDHSKWTSVIEDLRNGGFSWIQDFSVPDPYFILPVIYSASLLFLAEMTYATFQLTTGSAGQISKAQRILLQAPRVLALAALPIGCIMPAALTFYWLISVFFGIAQNLLLLSPRIMTALRAMPIDGKTTSSALLSPQGHLLPKNPVLNELKKHPYKAIFRRMIFRK